MRFNEYQLDKDKRYTPEGEWAWKCLTPGCLCVWTTKPKGRCVGCGGKKFKKVKNG